MSSIVLGSGIKTLNGVTPLAGAFTLISSDNSITFTPGAGELDLKAVGGGGGGITTIDTDSGSVTGSTIIISGGTSGAMFTASGGDTITESFNFLDLPASDSAGNGSISIGGSIFAHTQGSPSGSNTFLGCGAGNTDNTSVENTIVGSLAATAIETGSRNVAIGYNAGSAWTGSEADNIYIGSVPGLGNETATIRIGNPGGGIYGQTSCYVAGTWGASGLNANQGIMIMDQESRIAANSSGSDGQLLIGATSGALAWANITSTDNTIVVTNGTNSIDLSASSPLSVTTWVDVSGTSQAMVAGVGYAANNAGLVTLTLPASAIAGSQIVVTGKGSGGWKVAQNTGQSIFFGNLTTTTGVAGSLASTLRRDVVYLRCVTADTEWQVEGSVGNITVT